MRGYERRRIWATLSFAIALAGIGLALKLALGPAADKQPLFLLYLVPVLLSAQAGGWGPGVVCVAVIALGDLWLFEPPLARFFSVWEFQLGRWVSFTIVGVLVSLLTDRLRRAQQRAETSRQLQAVTLSSIGDAVITTDAKGLITFQNAEAEHLTGCASAEAIGKPVASVFVIVGETTHAPVENPVTAVLRTGVAQRRENHIVLIARDGFERRIEDSCAPISGVTGAVHGAVLVFRDCTDRQRAEAVLRERAALQEHLATIAATAPGVICAFRMRPDGRCSYPYASRSIKDIFGIEREDLREDASSTLAQIHPDDIGRVHASKAKSAATLTQWHDEFRVRHPEKGEIWVEGRSTPVREADGSMLWNGFLNDITERKRNEQALRVSEERFRQVTESIREVFWLTESADGGIAYVSPAYEAIWGRPRQRLYDHPTDWLDAIHPDDRARVEAALTKQVTGAYDEEYRVLRPDGELRWIRDRGFPVRDAHGTIIRVAGVAEDVTERRSLEAQLRQAQKMESIGQLAGGIAHDFNNWLTVIIGSTEMLADTITPNVASARSIDEIRAACDRAASLTKQLLAFSRKEVVELRVLDLNALVGDTEKMLRRLLGEDIVLSSTLDPAIGHVEVDAAQWVQLLVNLSVNARDAMPTGGRLTIETRHVELDGRRWVRLAIADSGSGMAPDVAAHIFEPFFTTKGVGIGTGLGLSVVHGIVQQGGGRLDVRSEPNAGTTFTIHLPVADAEIGAPIARPQAVSCNGTETILVVEDEPGVRRIAVVGLRRYGYTVLEAGDGVEALRVLEQHAGTVDLLVTDVIMPEMDGRELADRTRARYPSVGVLYTSGYTADTLVRHGVEGSHVAFLEKPYTPLTLAKHVRLALGNRPAVSVSKPA